jgi:transposase-like protein
MKKNKDVVIGVRERGGEVRLVHSKDATANSLWEVANKHISPDAKAIMTDENPATTSGWLRKVRHARIKHKDHVYVKGDVHTNTIESAFSLLKRGIIGSFHQVSIKHLQRYLNEFGYRFNRREDAELFEHTVGRMAGAKPMPYAKLVEENAFTPFVRPS